MRTKSVWGKSPSRLYRFLNLVKSRFGNNASVCIVGACDGKFVMPFLRNGMLVTAYELDEVAIYGGKKEFPIPRKNITKLEYIHNKYHNPIYKRIPSEYREIIGLKKRAEIENLSNHLKIIEENFYASTSDQQYNAVFTSCSIPYPCNFDISIEEIFNSLQKSVSTGGYLYMDYMMPLEDCHEWRPAHYLRRGDTQKYMDKEKWKILHIYEMNKPVFEAAHVDRPEDHFHRFGYVLAEHL